jgi:hypothetical protein
MQTLTALEDTLATDYLGKQQSVWRSTLIQAAASFERQARAAPTAADSAALMRRRAACLAAQTIIETVWSHRHLGPR